VSVRRLGGFSANFFSGGGGVGGVAGRDEGRSAARRRQIERALAGRRRRPGRLVATRRLNAVTSTSRFIRRCIDDVPTICDERRRTTRPDATRRDAARSARFGSGRRRISPPPRNISEAADATLMSRARKTV